MRIETAVYNFDKLFDKILNSRSGEPKVRGANLTARIGGTALTGKRSIIFKHYQTDILVVEEYSKDTLYLWIDANGYRSVTTKHYLNEALRAYGTDTGIYQRDFVWYWADGSEFSDGVAVWGNK